MGFSETLSEQRKLLNFRLGSDPVMFVILVMVVFSFLIWALVFVLDLHLPPEELAKENIPYTAYFDAVNWWPFPAFFLGVAPIIYLSWGAFLVAWRDLARTGVLQHADGSVPSQHALNDVLDSVRLRRRWAFLAAALAAVIINGLDLQEKGNVLFGDADLRQQAEHACQSFNSANKWFVEAQNLHFADSCTKFEKYDDEQRIEAPTADAVFILATWLQQFMIVFMVALAIGQMLLLGMLFWGFERLLPAARQHDLVLRLNAASEVGEFGLERWNYALNNFYWAALPALLGVFLSRAATPVEQYDPGQALLGIMVPACLLAPMIISILSRQSRLPFVWPEVGREGGFPAELYGRQVLWPMDRNWSSKLGIVLAFVLTALALGYEMSALLLFT